MKSILSFSELYFNRKCAGVRIVKRSMRCLINIDTHDISSFNYWDILLSGNGAVFFARRFGFDRWIQLYPSTGLL